MCMKHSNKTINKIRESVTNTINSEAWKKMDKRI